MSNQTQSEPNYLRDIAYFIMLILSELFLTVYSFHFWTWKWFHDNSETSFVIIVYFYLSMYIKPLLIIFIIITIIQMIS